MTDIFFSYSSKDRERVRVIRDKLVENGFCVFWDQTIPPGSDWDTFIRQHLGMAKCVVVFWSVRSVASDNVRHEATVAKQQGKLIPVLLESLNAQQFPMGLYITQGVNLSDWTGDIHDVEWGKLVGILKAQLTPTWIQRRLDEFEAELAAVKTQRDKLESRDKTFQTRIDREVEIHMELRREKERVENEALALKTSVDELRNKLSEKERITAELTEKLAKANQNATVLSQQINADKEQFQIKLKHLENQLIKLAKNPAKEPKIVVAVDNPSANPKSTTNLSFYTFKFTAIILTFLGIILSISGFMFGDLGKVYIGLIFIIISYIMLQLSIS